MRPQHGKIRTSLLLALMSLLAGCEKQSNDIQEIMNRELPFIYTISSLHAAAARSDLKNIRPSVIPTYRLTWNIEELYYQKKP